MKPEKWPSSSKNKMLQSASCRFVGGPVEPGGHVVADEDHAGASVRRRAGLPAHAQRGAEGVEPLFHQSLSHLLRAHVRLVDHQEFTQRIVSQASLSVLTSFRVRTCGVRGNQVHSINVQCLEVLNPNFQPILPLSKI